MTGLDDVQSFVRCLSSDPVCDDRITHKLRPSGRQHANLPRSPQGHRRRPSYVLSAHSRHAHRCGNAGQAARPPHPQPCSRVQRLASSREPCRMGNQCHRDRAECQRRHQVHEVAGQNLNSSYRRERKQVSQPRRGQRRFRGEALVASIACECVNNRPNLSWLHDPWAARKLMQLLANLVPNRV